jgi:uncharacterized protein (DUF983 family)
LALPLWVHALLWLPLTALLIILLLRVAKGALLILDYKRQTQKEGPAG